ncbi:MAG: DMT family transporter, partial [Sneathiella sp.]
MSLRTWGMLITLSFLWGGTFFFIELALLDFTPFTIVFLRVSVAALALFAYLLVKGEAIPRDATIWAIFLVMGLLNNIIPFSLITWGQTHITGSVASILNATTPLFAAILAHFFTRDEKLKRHKLLGILLGYCGVFIMMQPTLKDGISFESLGQLAILGAALSYGFAGIWGKRLGGSSAMVNAFGMLACSSLVMLPVVLVIEKPFSATPSLISIGAMLCLALVGTALAYILYFRVLVLAGAVNLLLVTFLIPITALLLGVGILGEAIHPFALTGMAIIFVGLALIDG